MTAIEELGHMLGEDVRKEELRSSSKTDLRSSSIVQKRIR